MADRKAVLKVEVEGFAVSVPVRYTKMSSAAIREQLVVTTKTVDGLTASKKYLLFDKSGNDVTGQVERKLRIIDANGKIREDSEVATYQVVDGKEETLQYPEATTVFQGFETIPSEKFFNYLQEGECRYEVYPENGKTPEETQMNENFMVLLAEYMIAHNVCLKMNDFYRSRDYYNYAMVMRAHKDSETEYGLEFILTMTKVEYNHRLKKTDLKSVLVSEKKGARVKLNV